MSCASSKLRPDWSPRWGFGEDLFGQGGLGYGATAAPGMGQGAFGAGEFGIEAETMLIAAPLLEEGTHQIQLRVISRDGGHADSSIQNVSSCPPPPPPASLQATNYDAQTTRLTLQIQ